MPLDARRHTNAADTTRWLINAGLAAKDIACLLAGYGRQLRELGIEIVRVWHSSLVLHPIVGAIDAEWWAESDQVGVSEVRRSQIKEANLPGGPSGHPKSHPVEFKCSLLPDSKLEHPVLEAVRNAGATQYLLLQTQQAGVPTLITSYAIAGPQLSPSELAAVHEVHAVFGVVALLLRERGIARALLHTYLGVDAGDRVLAGTIERGDGFAAEAAILFSDLRGFTAISEKHPREAVLDLLSEAFEVQVAAIETHGGQVLKFIGDGLLAIFSDGEDGPRASCMSALKAATAIEQRVEAVNQRRAEARVLLIDYNLSLHHGEVMYGNIGAPHRLDFTVIGPAVNQAARLEALGARENVKPALSSEFAQLCSANVECAGTFAVKGITSLELWRTVSPL